MIQFYNSNWHKPHGVFLKILTISLYQASLGGIGALSMIPNSPQYKGRCSFLASWNGFDIIFSRVSRLYIFCSSRVVPLTTIGPG
ncbi:MAG: hypothetical protein IPK94_08140 [Saprospiraceae bacterium]|nr:hypothetical protein [Saprospiraceae bacterium]